MHRYGLKNGNCDHGEGRKGLIKSGRRVGLSRPCSTYASRGPKDSGKQLKSPPLVFMTSNAHVRNYGWITTGSQVQASNVVDIHSSSYTHRRAGLFGLASL